MKKIRSAVLALLGAVLLAGAVHAGPQPVFGPQTFERTMGVSDLYDETFDVAEAGPYVLYVRNGDSEATRVDSATVEINGVAILTPQDFSESQAGFRRSVDLVQGSNTLVVDVAGDPGAFLTIAVGRLGELPVFVHGHIVLPWGRHDSERTLILAFKNGSPRAPRLLRAIFFNPAGEPVAVSPRFPLPPHGSLAAMVDTLIAEGQWEIGSVEVFYTGPGVARVFGTARQVHLATGQSETQSLEHGGHRIYRGRRDSEAPGQTRGMR